MFYYYKNGLEKRHYSDKNLAQYVLTDRNKNNLNAIQQGLYHILSQKKTEHYIVRKSMNKHQKKKKQSQLKQKKRRCFRSRTSNIVFWLVML